MVHIHRKLEEILRVFIGRGGVEACAIVRRDGVLLCVVPRIRCESVAAMSAAILAAAEMSSSYLGKGVPDRVIVDTPDGSIVVVGAGSKALVATLTSKSCIVQEIVVEQERVAADVKALLRDERVFDFLEGQT